MSYSCVLKHNTSNPNVINKSTSTVASVDCEFKAPVDVENPEVYIAATDAYDGVNYMYIAEFGRYYYAKAIANNGQTITFQCQSDPLMSFKSAILNSPAVIARNPWHFDMYIPDSKLPVESRTQTAIYNFPNTDKFTHNKFVLTTLGCGGS